MYVNHYAKRVANNNPRKIRPPPPPPSTEFLTKTNAGTSTKSSCFQHVAYIRKNS